MNNDNTSVKTNNIAFSPATDDKEQCCGNLKKGKEAYKKYQGGFFNDYQS
jgi:hypothetical protein